MHVQLSSLVLVFINLLFISSHCNVITITKCTGKLKKLANYN